jgi:hypothetical protein
VEYLFFESVGIDYLVRVYANELTGNITRIVTKGNPEKNYAFFIGTSDMKDTQSLNLEDAIERKSDLKPDLALKINARSGIQCGVRGGLWQSQVRT